MLTAAHSTQPVVVGTYLLMQRKTPDGVVIACDFTGNDWDMEEPMIEGHRGAVISLAALAMAIEGATEREEPFDCTMCLRPQEAGAKGWQNPSPPPTANAEAVICWDCIQQADMAFGRDPDTDWQRRIKPSDRWR